jgi:hypothetical protein
VPLRNQREAGVCAAGSFAMGVSYVDFAAFDVP